MRLTCRPNRVLPLRMRTRRDAQRRVYNAADLVKTASVAARMSGATAAGVRDPSDRPVIANITAQAGPDALSPPQTPTKRIEKDAADPTQSKKARTEGTSTPTSITVIDVRLMRSLLLCNDLID